MDLKFRCSGCGAKLAAEPQLVGQKVACPRCAIAVTVPSPSLPPGAILGGFRIDHLLGYGSMGEVFLATQMSMDRPVALKVLPKALTADQENVDFFKNEVRTLARLDHPNIVGAFEAGEYQGMHFLAMTFVDGESLAEKVERDGPLDEFEALRIVSKVARALEYAWDKFKLLHRDVKPANIMIDAYGDVKLMDLGLAKNFSGNEVGAGRFAYGTPDYMSPEQIRALNNLDFRTDVYALGCTLYHLLAGTAPYIAAGPNEVVHKHLHDPVPSIRRVKPDISEGTDRLIQSMLAKSADERPSSWGSLIQEIKRCQRQVETQRASESHGSGGASGRKMRPAPAADAVDYTRPVLVTPRKSRAPLLAAFLIGVIFIVGCTWFGIAWLDRQTIVIPGEGGRVQRQPTNTETVLVPIDGSLPPSSSSPPTSTDVVATVPPVPPIDTTTPPVETVPEGPDLNAVADNMRAAELYEYENPEDLDGAIMLYRVVTDAKSGLPVEERANAAIKRLEGARDAAVAKLVADLRAQAMALADRNDFAAAVKLVREYTGRYASLSMKQRDAIAADVTKRQRDQNAAAERVRALANDAYLELANTLASKLLTNDIATLQATIDAASGNRALEPRRADARAIGDAALEAGRLRTRLAVALQKLAGQEKAHSFTIGKDVQQVFVQGLDQTGRVKGKKQVGTGFVGVSFSMDELSYEDKVRLISIDETPATHIAVGLLGEYNSRLGDARSAFVRAGDAPLAVALLRQFDVLHAAPPEDATVPDKTAPAVPLVPADSGAATAMQGTPTDVPDADVPRDRLVLWLRADLDVDADRRDLVRTWSDKSGRGHHATSDGARTRPTLQRSSLNGQPIVRFDGEEDFLKIGHPLIDGATGATFIIVMDLGGEELSAEVRPFGCAGTVDDDEGNFFRLDFWGIGEAGKPSFTLSTARRGYISAVGPTRRNRNTGGVIVSAAMEPGYVVLRDNGTPGPVNRLSWGSNLTLSSPGDKYLGASLEKGSAMGHFKGGIAEVLVYDRALSQQQIGRIEAYLGRKYGIPVAR